ncbi:uncharacterized protein RSE6_12350 [Rhynchosporium secalis]|uniref:Uncharacterized protein n=1 Tax=Rhynchosporium secalis TaxID=38038 RepID=A0A1E1MQ64_RHYSE|nr:uncharacterized protein RSE6_12350 [Rhynchosporium secalis]
MRTISEPCEYPDTTSFVCGHVLNAVAICVALFDSLTVNNQAQIKDFIAYSHVQTPLNITTSQISLYTRLIIIHTQDRQIRCSHSRSQRIKERRPDENPYISRLKCPTCEYHGVGFTDGGRGELVVGCLLAADAKSREVGRPYQNIKTKKINI